MVEPHIFIFLGSDELQKQKKIEALQKKIFPPGLKDLNLNVIYADKKRLTPKEVKETLSHLPTSGAQRRMVIIRMAHRLKKANQATLLEEGLKARDKIVLILDVPDEKGGKERIKEFINMGAQVVRFKSEVPINIFDLGRAIMRRRPAVALRILSTLLGSRERTEKILGTIFWQWERSRSERSLSESTYKKGLKLILDADKRLKSSSSAYARESLILEALVVKLAYLA